MHTLGTIECESARTDLYTFNGRVELAGNYQRSQGLTSALPLMAENLLLRGSRIKNTEWAVGCAVYIGEWSPSCTSCKTFKNTKIILRQLT